MNDKTDVTIPPEFQRLQLAASKDETRYNILGVHFNEKVAAATDGHVLAVRRKSAEWEGLPNNENIRFANAKAKPRNCNLFQRLGTKLLSAFSNETAEVIDGQFPNWQQSHIVPSLEAEKYVNEDGSEGVKEPITICFNPYLLAKLAESLGVEKKNPNQSFVTLTFFPERHEGLIVTTSDKECFGVLMPMRKEGQDYTDTAKHIKEVLK